MCAGNAIMLEIYYAPKDFIISMHLKEFDRLFGQSKSGWDHVNLALIWWSEKIWGRYF